MNILRTPPVTVLAGLLGILAFPALGAAQNKPDYEAVLEREHPELYDLLIRVERAHGVMFGGLVAEGETMRASAEKLPTFGFELEMVERLTFMVAEEGRADDVKEEAEAGFAALGPRAAAVITRANAFHREVLGILADRSIPSFNERRLAVAAAVERYRSQPEISVPGVPTDMDILYDHPQTLDFRTGYTDLGGLIWAGYWLKLAATEPITDIEDPARRAMGIDTVTARYHMKLSYGDPPEFFPSELPMAPAISPGIIFLSPEAAIIWDNVSMMQEVISDILASPDLVDAQSAIDLTVEHFTDPNYRRREQDYWEIMALRHGIFNQGSYPLAYREDSERNAGGHAAHLAGGGSPIMGGMPG